MLKGLYLHFHCPAVVFILHPKQEELFPPESPEGAQVSKPEAIHQPDQGSGEPIAKRLGHRQGSRITVAVRDMPILNDATMAEARALHLDRFADTLTTTGCGCEIGVRLDCMPTELAKAVEDCTLIIAKGMANYESLSEYTGLPAVAFLMAAKCDPIAEEVGVRRGSKVAILQDRN